MSAPVILATPRPLAALYNHRTRYEAGLYAPDGRLAAVLAFDAKRTKRALLQAAIRKGPDVLRLAEITDADEFQWTDGGWTLGAAGWRVRWTGATERDRACQALQAA